MQKRCWGCGRILASDNFLGLCASCEAAGVQRPTASQPIRLDSAQPNGAPPVARVVVTGVDIPLSFWIDIAFKVTLAFLVAGIVLGIPVGIAVALILRAL